MLDYTKAAFNKTVEDIKKCTFLFSIVAHVFTIAYLLYTIIARSGALWANIALLAITVAYFVFFLILSRGETSKTKKRVKSTVTRIFKRCKLFIKFLTLAVLVYGVYVTAGNVQPLSVVLLAFTLVGWVLQVLLEIVSTVIERRVKFFLEALEADWQTMTAPIKTAGNFFKRLSGKEIEEAPEPTKNRLILDQMVAAAKEKKAEEKKAAKQAKREEKLRKQGNAETPVSTEIAATNNAPARKKPFWKK
ncbi:MAG: hypothetical protein IJX88_01935 [Clostridia bacterium]|nr:hypothetical protein [Clostridia bacterium]